jgi:hypothetical protein
MDFRTGPFHPARKRPSQLGLDQEGGNGPGRLDMHMGDNTIVIRPATVTPRSVLVRHPPSESLNFRVADPGAEWFAWQAAWRGRLCLLRVDFIPSGGAANEMSN